MTHKKSKYNFFVPYKKSKTIIFNSLSGSIGLFDEKMMKKYKSNSFTKNEKEILLKKGILIESNYNEKEKINTDRIHGIENSSTMHIRLWTTSACNARCYYCFEKGIKVVHMSKDTADALIKYIDSISKPKMEINFEWFGGEPLLNTSIMDYIVDNLKPLCDKKECKISGSIISNGSLITEAIVNKMINKWNIKYIQITLDGNKNLYNKTKDYLNPNIHNFDTVIKNIKVLSDHNIHVAIRMNYDTTNYDSLSSLLDYLHQELNNYKNIFYYIYPIWSSLNEDDKNAFSSKSKADTNIVELFKKIVNYKMTSLRELARLNYKKYQCVSCNNNSFTVFPDGKIGKCSEAFKKIVGDVWQGITDKETFNYWSKTALDKKCESCKFLPLCQGGCRSSHFTKMPQCFAYKDILPDILKWYVDTLEENKIK